MYMCRPPDRHTTNGCVAENPEPEKGMTDSTTSLEEQCPFRVLNDTSYDRMLRKLENGSAWEWSFTSMKCDKDTSGRCICPKNMNVLSKVEPGRIVRIENGRQYPVYRAREAGPHIAAFGGGTVVEVAVYMSLMVGKNRMRYAAEVTSSLRNMELAGAKTVKLSIHLDDEGMSGRVMRVELPITEIDRIHDTIIGARNALKRADELARCEPCA